MTRRRDRERRPGRRAPYLEPRRRLLVLAEGKCTEPEYVEEFRKWVRNHLVIVKVAKDRGVPLTLVRTAKDYQAESRKAAKRERDDNEAYDEIWCVFDRDEHPNVNQALDEARTAGIQVAMSNPCFELWLLLHFRESPGPQSRDHLQSMTKQFLPGYDKHVPFDDLKAGYEEAKRRAERLDVEAEEAGESMRNPTTGVYRLMGAIEG